MFSKNVKISNSNKEKNVCVKIKYAKKYISKKVHKNIFNCIRKKVWAK